MDKQTSPAAQDRGHNADSPWQMPVSGWKDVAVRTWKESSEDNVGIVAAGVAFYGFVALVPLLGAIVLTYGLVADPQTVVRHFGALTAVLPPDVAQLVGDQLMNVVQTSGTKKGLGLALALAIALWGARNGAGSIITALNIAYEEEEKRGFFKVTLIALAMTFAAVAVALLAIGATTVLGALGDFLPNAGPVGIIVSKVLTYLLLALAAAAAVATLYRYAPSREKARWEWITPGSLLAAVAWLVLTLGFGFYVTNFGNYGATYGSLGAVIVLLTWLYLSSYVLLFCAELNSELEHQTVKDTTAGGAQPLGQRGAWSADHVAGGGAQPARLESPQPVPQTQRDVAPVEAVGRSSQQGHPYVTSRVTARAGQLAGLRKVGTISSILSTLGLAMMRRKGRELVGATMLATAAGIALSRRRN